VPESELQKILLANTTRGQRGTQPGLQSILFEQLDIRKASHRETKLAQFRPDNGTPDIRGVPIDPGQPFDPEGAGFDIESARTAGLEPDEMGHMPSRVPETGLLLKGRRHPTFNKTLEAEKRLGFRVFKRNGQLFSESVEKPTAEQLIARQPQVEAPPFQRTEEAFVDPALRPTEIPKAFLERQEKATNTATKRIAFRTISSAFGGLPELAMSPEEAAKLEPESVTENVLQRAGEFAGFLLGAPLKLGIAITARVLPKLASPLLKSITHLGIASGLAGNQALREVINTPNVENFKGILEEKVKSTALGALTGGRFGLASFLPKFWERALVNIAGTQLLDKALGVPTVAGVVRGDISKKEVSDVVFNTMLDLVFARGHTPTRRERNEARIIASNIARQVNLKKLNDEVAALRRIGGKSRLKNVEQRIAGVSELTKASVTSRTISREAGTTKKARTELAQAKGREELQKAKVEIKAIDAVRAGRNELRKAKAEFDKLTEATVLTKEGRNVTARVQNILENLKKEKELRQSPTGRELLRQSLKLQESVGNLQKEALPKTEVIQRKGKPPVVTGERLPKAGARTQTEIEKFGKTNSLLTSDQKIESTKVGILDKAINDFAEGKIRQGELISKFNDAVVKKAEKVAEKLPVAEKAVSEAKPKKGETVETRKKNLNEALDNLADERGEIIDAGGSLRRGSLADAMRVALVVRGDLTEMMTAIETAIKRNRLDIAEMIVEKARLGAETSTLKPGLSKDSPKFKGAEEALKKSKEEAVERLRRLKEKLKFELSKKEVPRGQAKIEAKAVPEVKRPKPTLVKGGKPQENLALGVQATVPPGKIKTVQGKKEGLFAPEKPKGEQQDVFAADLEKQIVDFPDGKAKIIGDSRKFDSHEQALKALKRREKAVRRTGEKVKVGMEAENPVFDILGDIKLRKKDRGPKGELSEEMKALQSKYRNKKIFDPNGQTLDEHAANRGITEEQLRQQLLNAELPTVRLRETKAKEAFFLENEESKIRYENKLKLELSPKEKKNFDETLKFFEEKAKLNAEKNILERGKETNPLPRSDEAQFGIGLGGLKLPKIEISIGKRGSLKIKFSDSEKENAWNEARGLPRKTLFSKIIDKVNALKIGFTRQFVHLPNNDPVFAEAKEILRQLKGSFGISSRESIELVKQLTKDVKFEDIDLAMRKLKLEDYREGLRKDLDAPFGFDAKEIALELSKIDKAIETSPQAKRVAIETRLILDELGQKLVDAGILTDAQVKNQQYFHRQILKYSMEEENFGGMGRKKLKKPRPGFAKARKGSTLSDNTDYLQALYSYVTDAKHDIRVMEMLGKLKKKYDVLPELKKKNKGLSFDKLLERAPEDHVLWQPEKGNLLFKTNSVSDKIANKLLEDTIISDLELFPSGEKKSINITADDLRAVLAIGAKKQMWLIPDKLANQLNDLSGEALLGSSANDFLKTTGIAAVTRSWKVWTLLSPTRAVQYNFRNFLGDSESVWAAQPAIFNEVSRATKELKDYFFFQKPMSKELREFNVRGGIGSTFVEVEIRDLKLVEDFERLYLKRRVRPKAIAEFGFDEIKKAFNKVATLTEFREDILRYAGYLHYKNQAKTGNIKNFGASNKVEVLALKDPLDQAAKLSRELLGDYGAISKYGETLRNSAIPFWSWMEINAKRWPKLVKNSFEEGKGAGSRALSVTGGKLVAGFYARMAAAYTATYLWNNFVAPQVFGESIENELGEYDRRRLHLSFGRNDDGTVRFLRTPTATSDFLEWFGLNEIPVLFDMVSRGVISIKDAALQLTKSPVNKLVQGINPAFKLPAELATGKRSFPDVFNPSPIIDKWDHFLRTWQLESIYRKFKGIPQRHSIGENILKKILLITEYDPDEIAYYDTLRLKGEFKRKVLGIEGGFGVSAKSQTYRNYKKALKLGKKDLADTLLEEMAEKGWINGLEQSLRAMNPMFGLSEVNQIKFRLQFLNGLQRQKLQRAQRYYDQVLKESKIPNELKRRSRRKARQEEREFKRQQFRTNLTRLQP
jgi:hypothetical protein